LKFLKYILYCIYLAISAAVGSPDLNSTFKDTVIGGILLVIVIVSWLAIYFPLKYHTYLSAWKVILFTILIWVGVIWLFCAGAIIIEFLISN